MSGWWFRPAPLGRVAILRVLIYLFIPVDVLLTSSWVREHAALGDVLYRPLRVASLLHLPTPTTHLVDALAALLVGGSLAAATGWRPRVTGGAVAVLYFAWMLVAMSYGKVDHDRFGFLVALAVLPTVGRAKASDRSESEAAGWALRCTQVAVVLTYFLAGCAKVRYGGWHWPTGATLEWALLRRNTPFSTWLIDKPQILVPMQFAMISAELLSPLLLLVRSDRGRTRVALGMWSFHLATFAGITIIFLPHCIAIFAFVPLERWWAARKPDRTAENQLPRYSDDVSPPQLRVAVSDQG